jgi:HEPN domain-containing protein
MKMAELAHENGIYSRCVSMSQQVVEKMLKSALAMVGFYGLKKHEMLQHFTEEYNKILAEDLMSKIIKLVRPLESEWIRSRYPDWTDPTQPVWTPSEQYNEDDAKKALSGAKEVHKLILGIMREQFDFIDDC